MERLITDQWSALAEFDPKHEIKLIVDEWGCWHPEGTEINKQHLFEQMGCLRDALVAASTLDTFNRHADKVDMANIAQLVNNLHSLFLADGDKFVATPYVLRLRDVSAAPERSRSVRVDVETPDLTFKAGGKDDHLPRVSGSASRKDANLIISLVHVHASEPVDIEIRLRGGRAASGLRQVLTHKELNAHNTFENPSVVKPETIPADLSGTSLRVTLAPASVNRLDVRLG